MPQKGGAIGARAVCALLYSTAELCNVVSTLAICTAMICPLALSCRIVSVAVVWRVYCLSFDQYSTCEVLSAGQPMAAVLLG
jgi:hypothetical protein